MKILWLSLAVVFWFVGASPAKADVDHHCLNQCMSAGASASPCLKQCSYASNGGLAKPETSVRDANAHRVLSPLIPLKDKEVLLKPKKAMPVLPNKDYVCLNQCLHNGRPYAACDAGCVKTDCPTNAVLCATSSKAVTSTALSPQ